MSLLLTVGLVVAVTVVTRKMQTTSLTHPNPNTIRPLTICKGKCMPGVRHDFGAHSSSRFPSTARLVTQTDTQTQTRLNALHTSRG